MYRGTIRNRSVAIFAPQSPADCALECMASPLGFHVAQKYTRLALHLQNGHAAAGVAAAQQVGLGLPSSTQERGPDGARPNPPTSTRGQKHASRQPLHNKLWLLRGHTRAPGHTVGVGGNVGKGHLRALKLHVAKRIGEQWAAQGKQAGSRGRRGAPHTLMRAGAAGQPMRGHSAAAQARGNG